MNMQSLLFLDDEPLFAQRIPLRNPQQIKPAAQALSIQTAVPSQFQTG
jgi:hypothetical protein